MKSLPFLLLFTSFCFSVRSQEKVYTNVEVPPKYPGGDEALAQYLIDNFCISQDSVKPDDPFTLLVSFIVLRNGTITDVKSVNMRSSHAERIFVAAVKKMPRWIPGKHKGKPVNVEFQLPLRFSPQQ